MMTCQCAHHTGGCRNEVYRWWLAPLCWACLFWGCDLRRTANGDFTFRPTPPK